LIRIRNSLVHAACMRHCAIAQMNGTSIPAANGAAVFPTIEDYVGNTPLVRLQRLPGRVAAERNNVILGKLEGNNPAGSVKDR